MSPKRFLGAARLLLASACAVACGTRSDPKADSCRTPAEFPNAEGAPSGCEVVSVLACKSTQGAVVLCEGTDAGDCGGPVEAGSCTHACSDVAYALKCPEHGTFLGSPPGAPSGCITLSTPPSGPALSCCPCLDP